jgi:hypothetical protein
MYNICGPGDTAVGIVNTSTVPSGDAYSFVALTPEKFVPKYMETDELNPEPNNTTEVLLSAKAEDGTTEVTVNGASTVVNHPLT